jgi:hypothetical protein
LIGLFVSFYQYGNVENKIFVRQGKKRQTKKQNGKKICPPGEAKEKASFASCKFIVT